MTFSKRSIYSLYFLLFPVIGASPAYGQDCNSNALLDSIDLASGDFTLNSMASSDAITSASSSFPANIVESFPKGILSADVDGDGVADLLSFDNQELVVETSSDMLVSRTRLGEKFSDYSFPDCQAEDSSEFCSLRSGVDIGISILNDFNFIDLNSDGFLDTVVYAQESFREQRDGSIIFDGVRTERLLVLFGRGDGGFRVSSFDINNSGSPVGTYDTGKILLSNVSGDSSLDLTLALTNFSGEVHTRVFEGALIPVSSDSNGNSIPDECEAAAGESYAFVNTYLGMVNILELINDSLLPAVSGGVTSNIFFEIFLSEEASTPYSSVVPFPVGSAGDPLQIDVILGDVLNLPEDQFGYLKVRHDGGLSGRNMHYRFDQDEIDFFFPSGLVQPLSGRSVATFNSFDPNSVVNDQRSELEVANYLTIANLDSIGRTFKVSLYGAEGKFLDSARIGIPAQDSRFINLNELKAFSSPDYQEDDFFGIVVVDPEAGRDGEYLAEVGRYNPPQAGTNDHPYAFNISLKNPVNIQKTISISQGAGAENWIEVSNPTESSIRLAYEVYAENGNLLASSSLQLEPFSYQHIHASGLLETSISGFIRFTPDSNHDAYVLGGISYFPDSAKSEVSGAFVNESVLPESGPLTTSYNSFLGFNNFLRLSNTSGIDQTYTVSWESSGQLLSGSQFVPAFASVDLGFISGVDTLGSLYEVPGDSYGKIIVDPLNGSSFMAQMLRVSFNSSFEFKAAASYLAR